MPALVIVAVRYLIMAAVQLGIWSLVEKYGLPLLNSAIKEVAELFGATEEEAKDLVANEVLQAFEQVGIFAITLRSKLPLKVADYLGFTTKGWSMRKLSSKFASLTGKSVATATVTTVATTAEVAKVAEVVAKNTGTSLSIVTTLYKGIMSFVGVTALVAMTIGNFIDFANWQGAYQKTFEKLFTSLGFPPDSPMPKAKSVSADTWTKIYTVVEELNPVSIAFPWEDTVKPYTRANLSDAVDHFAANIALNGGQATWKNVWGLLLPCIKIKGKSNTTVTASSTASSTSSQLTVPKVQVFTGVLSQGVLGKGLEFQARPDDLIENAQEMLDAAANNLAPFIASMSSRITYQVKVVSSITTKDGFTQKGSVTQILTGYDTKGVAKYKTVINKFAVLDIYILNDKNTRVKITTIVLGPVDSVKFQVGQGTITAIETGLSKVASTSNINDIKGISTSAPLTVLTPGINTVTAPQTQLHFVIGQSGSSEIWDNTIISSYRGSYREVSYAEWKANPQKSINTGLAGVTEFIAAAERTTQPVVTPSAPVSSPSSGSSSPSAPVVSAPVVQAPTPQPAPAPVIKKGASASNLSEWYTANGQSLPSISQRATLYQQYGLGQASYYTGTAEQNTNLLNKLKSM